MSFFPYELDISHVVLSFRYTLLRYLGDSVSFPILRSFSFALHLSRNVGDSVYSL